MTLKPIFISTMIGASALLAAPASADYMGRCNKLIGEWKSCTTTSSNCAREEAAIREQCKCHALKGKEWKLVMAAVAKDNVCGNEDPPTIEIPPPHEPPPRIVNDPHGRGGGGGGGEQGKQK